MSILDRFIARQYLQNILILFVILFSIVFVVDISLNYDEYVGIADELLRAKGAASTGRKLFLAVALAWDLWWPRLFQLFGYMLGLVLVGAMGFTCAQMVKHRECVAMLSGGISLQRVARPLVAVALFMSALQILDRELILPELAPLLTRGKNDAGRERMGASKHPLSVDAQGRLFYIQSADLDAQIIRGLWVWERDPKGLMTRRISAESGVWKNGAWELQSGRAEWRTADGRAMVEPITRLETDMDPTALRLRRYEGYANNLSTRQVSELVHRLTHSPQPPVQRLEALERNRWGRFAGVACNVLAVLICLPFFLRREPTNMLVQSLMAAPIALVVLVGAQLGTTAGIPALPPQVGVLIPVMILIPLAIAACTSVKT